MSTRTDMKLLGSHVLIILILNVFLLSYAEWMALFNPAAITIQTNSIERLHVVITGLPDEISANINDWSYVRLISENERVAIIANQDGIDFIAIGSNVHTWETFFEIEGIFLGSSRAFVEVRTQNKTMERSKEMVNVTVVRPARLVDTMFSATVVVLLAILFINFGAAIELNVMKEIVQKPVGLAIGTVCQLVFMPLFAYGLGIGLFPQSPELVLGLFLTGIAPAGGASNIWALLLGGNVNLSIAMTTISTIASFGTIPLWLFALGRTVFDRANIGVPYLRITMIAASLLIPLAIGLGIQKWLPKIGKLLVRILKPLSLVFLIIIIVFASFTNNYMLQLVSWQVAVAGFSLPFLGYCFGCTAAVIFKQPSADIVAIGIETGMQNTALTMFLLTLSLEQPAADVTMIIPIAVSIVTPVPLFVMLVIKKVKQFLDNRKSSKREKQFVLVETSSTSSTVN